MLALQEVENARKARKEEAEKQRSDYNRKEEEYKKTIEEDWRARKESGDTVTGY